MSRSRAPRASDGPRGPAAQGVDSGALQLPKGAPPRFATPRDPTRATRGPDVADVMARLGGWEPMPWQRQVLDVAFEEDEDGELAYREVVIVVPRQAGKTSLLLAVQVHRALEFGRPQSSIYTAQTRQDAVLKFLDEHLPILKASPLGGFFKERKTTGSESLRWENGSVHAIKAPTKEAGHGGTTDLAQIDEAFALADSRLEQGLKPAMITRRSPQTWIVSAAGDDTSHYLLEKVKVGRDRALLGQQSGSCYFEWSASDDMPADDPATWWAVHPALGFTITEKAIRADLESMPLVEFERAYLARWPGKRHSRIIPEELWNATQDAHTRVEDPVAFAIDVSPDRSRAAISVAGRRADGLFHVEVVKADAGTEWIVAASKALLAKWKGSVIGLDAGSSAGSLVPELRSEGIEPVQLKLQDVVRATGSFVDQVSARKLRQPGGSLGLELAVAGATKRRLSDAWAWGRAEGVDITPLVSCTLALWIHTTRPAPAEYSWLIA